MLNSIGPPDPLPQMWVLGRVELGAKAPTSLRAARHRTCSRRPAGVSAMDALPASSRAVLPRHRQEASIFHSRFNSASRLEAIATSNKKLLVVPGIARNKKLLGGGHHH